MKRNIGVGDLKISRYEKKLVKRVLDSNRLSYGPMTKSFEKRFAQLHDSRFAIFTNSGTSCLQIAIAALKEKYNWKDGDEIIVPSTTFVATPNTVIYNNMKPVFVDVDPHTFNINVKKIEEKVTEKTVAIIAVHLLGLPADMGPILDLAKKYGLKVIEDSAETMFASYKGRRVGSIGAIGCFSTYVAHHIVTGVGGLCTTSDPELAVIIRSLANHGRDSIYINIDDDSKRNGKQLNEIIARRFNFVRYGFSYRCTEIEAAIGLGQLKRKDSIIKRRKQIAQKYLEGLQDLSKYLQFQEANKDAENVYMLFGIVLKKGSKSGIINYLEGHGIETRDMLPLVNQPIYSKYFKAKKKDYPVSNFLAQQAFYIGCHQYITDMEISYIIKTFHDYFK